MERHKKFSGLEEAVLFETREKRARQKIQFTTGYVPNRETEEVGRERGRERERMKN